MRIKKALFDTPEEQAGLSLFTDCREGALPKTGYPGNSEALTGSS
jgi:hypothetical protein